MCHVCGLHPHPRGTGVDGLCLRAASVWSRIVGRSLRGEAMNAGDQNLNGVSNFSAPCSETHVSSPLMSARVLIRMSDGHSVLEERGDVLTRLFQISFFQRLKTICAKNGEAPISNRLGIAVYRRSGAPCRSKVWDPRATSNLAHTASRPGLTLRSLYPCAVSLASLCAAAKSCGTWRETWAPVHRTRRRGRGKRPWHGSRGRRRSYRPRERYR